MKTRFLLIPALLISFCSCSSSKEEEEKSSKEIGKQQISEGNLPKKNIKDLFIQERGKERKYSSDFLNLADVFGQEKRYQEAIEFCEAKIALGGSKTDLWYAKYKLGECYQAIGNWELALLSYLQAYEQNPSIAEPLEKLLLTTGCKEKALLLIFC